VIRRILVKGASGAGKSTLGLHLAEHLGLPLVELDALHHRPNWAAASPSELRDSVLAALDDGRGWIVDGNYDSKLGTLLWDRAELIVWLDLPLPIKLTRLAHRTARRILRHEALWNGNQESLKSALWGADALFPWTVRTHFRHRREWPQRLVGRPFVRLRSAREVKAWLSDFLASENRSGHVRRAR
jgi:adenylate kinase family enzyme